MHILSRGDGMSDVVREVEQDSFTVRDEIYRLLGLYPFLRLEKVGKTYLGKELLALRLGKRDRYVLYAAAFHGRERISAGVCLRFIERLCRAVLLGGEVAGVPVRQALGDRGLLALPLVNPDGVDIALHGEKAAGGDGRVKRLCGGHFDLWNANARGVDINHNFDAGWEELRRAEEGAGIFGPGPTRYGGPRPESEAETAALCGLCRRYPVAHVLALHTQGEVIYWHYGEHTPPRAARMAQILASSSGYALDEPAGLASHGGFKDWFIREFRRPGFTVELGKGVNPLPAAALDGIYRRVEEMLMLALIL